MTRQAAYRKRQSEKGWRRVEVSLSPDDAHRLERMKQKMTSSAEEVLRMALLQVCFEENDPDPLMNPEGWKR